MTYLLLILVAAIWGVVFYKIFTGLKSSDNSVASNYSITQKRDSSLFKADTFSIHNNYRDPFLPSERRVVAENGNKSNNTKPLVKQPIVKQEVIKWPGIEYNGMIKSKKSAQQLALVKINGQTDFMTKGSSCSGVELLKVFKDSIQVAYSGEKKTIKK